MAWMIRLRPPPAARESGQATPRLMLALAVVGLTLGLLLTAVSVYAIFTASTSVTSNDFVSDTLDSGSGLTAPVSGSDVNLSWTATVDTYASGHRVLRSTTSGGPYTQIAEVTPRATTTYTDSPADGTYYYVLRSFYQNWESANSNEVSATVSVAPCTVGDTGFLSPSAEAADTGGDGNGFELNPTNAFADGGGNASNINGSADRHRYYDYGISIGGSCAIAGIEVRLDWWLDGTAGTNTMDVELSWDGGTSWTSAQTDTQETTTEHTVVLGSPTDAWGRSWTASELSDANFRVRITTNSTNSNRDFFLDWVPVKVYYEPRAVTILDAWTTGLTHTVSAGDNRLLLFAVGYENGSDPGVSAVTYGGQALTPIIADVAGTTTVGRVELWYLNEAGIAAASGNTFSVTWGGTAPSDPMYAAATYENVSQSNPISDSASNSTDASTPNPITATVNVTDGDMAVAAAIAGNDGSYAWGGGWTEGTDQTSGSTTTMSSAENAATLSSTDTASATHSGPNRQAIVAAVLSPAQASCTAGDTGFLDASAEAADTGGDGNGFELNPTNAFADGGGNASNINGAADRHRYYDYGISIGGRCAIAGIEVRLDWWLDSTSATSSMSVELSWDGGTSWTSAQTDTQETTTEHTVVLGGPTDTWGRTWSVGEFSNVNFRVRITSNSSGFGSGSRDFFLDWVPVKVYYEPPPPAGAVAILDAWTTGTTHAVSAGTNRLLLVGVYGEDSGVIASINTVTWGGQTLTEIGEATVGTGYSNLVWMGYLNEAGIAAASGSTIVATWSGTTPNESVLYAAVTLQNVDQTTPIGDSSPGTATSASTVQIASVLNVSAGDMAAYVTVSGEQGRTHTPDTGYTEGTEEDSGGVGQVASNATRVISSAGTEQPTATWSGGANVRLGIVGAVINMAP